MKCEATDAWVINECKDSPAPDSGNPVLHSKGEALKSAPGVKVQHGSKDQEIENLKRLLASVSQRLDALKSR